METHSVHGSLNRGITVVCNSKMEGIIWTIKTLYSDNVVNAEKNKQRD